MSYPGDGKVKLPLNRISGTDFPGQNMLSNNSRKNRLKNSPNE
jgi:hypothetical protein